MHCKINPGNYANIFMFGISTRWAQWFNWMQTRRKESRTISLATNVDQFHTLAGYQFGKFGEMFGKLKQIRNRFQ